MINDLKEFEKFLKICRKQGVSDVTCNGISVKLGNLPSRSEDEEMEEPLTPDALTPDQLIFYATQNVGGSQ